MKARRESWALTLALLVLVILSCSLRAFGIGIQPSRIDAIIPYGETETIQVTLTNPGDAPLHVDVSLVGLEMAKDGSLLWLGNDGTDATGNIYAYADISPHVSFEPATFTVDPHSETTLLAQVRAPDVYEEEDMAGCVGALWFDIVDASADSSGASPFNTVFRLIAFVLIQFEGGQRRAAELTSLPVYQDEQMNLHLPFLFSNQGNAHVSLTGQVVIREAESGEIVDAVGFSEGTALPQRPREYQAVWKSSSLRQGKFVAEFTVTYDTNAPDLTVAVPFEVDEGLLVSSTEQN
ncbi:hypothetical protein ACFLSF_01795 [Candidatus Bipolaricaulota bacterium]